MYRFILFISFLFVFISCDGEATNDPKIEKNGPSKIIIVNKTDYDVKEFYYKIDEAPSYENLGIKLNTEILSDGAKIKYCPTKAGNYYFTFVRQNGSYDTNLYISSERELNLGLNSGVITLELLPFNFYYNNSFNSDIECKEGD